jgi:hypothetical protein|tara:strand:- start:185 stop:703 length:519 start_codon:yes stop_codon:yes gene_type:complete
MDEGIRNNLKSDNRLSNEANFQETIDQILVFLSWGRRDDLYVLGDEGDGDDGMLEPNDVFEEELENSLELMEKVGQTSIIKFRLPLYEEVFGSLTKKDFVFPGNEDNAYDMYLGGYKELISATIVTLEKYGTVKQDKNIFFLKTEKEDIILTNNSFSLQSALSSALHDVLCF